MMATNDGVKPKYFATYNIHINVTRSIGHVAMLYQIYKKIQLVKQPRNPSPHTIAAVHATRKDPPHAGISDTNDCGDTLRGHSAVKNMPDPPHTLALAGNFLDLTMTTWKYTLHNVLNHRLVPEPYCDVL